MTVLTIYFFSIINLNLIFKVLKKEKSKELKKNKVRLVRNNFLCRFECIFFLYIYIYIIQYCGMVTDRFMLKKKKKKILYDDVSGLQHLGFSICFCFSNETMYALLFLAIAILFQVGLY